MISLQVSYLQALKGIRENMFREIRYTKQKLSDEECVKILEKGTSGVLSLLSDDGYPYGVPLSYTYHDSVLYFHGNGTGHKVDAIRNSEKASFCVIEKDQVIPAELTTYYRSVIVFGKVRILEDKAEKRKALLHLAEKYAPDLDDFSKDYVEKQLTGTCVMECSVEYMTGKQAIELTRTGGKNEF